MGGKYIKLHGTIGNRLPVLTTCITIFYIDVYRIDIISRSVDLLHSILLDYQSLYGHGKEDESGLSSCDLLGSDAGTVPPDDLLH